MGIDHEQLSVSLRSKGLIKNESGEWVKTKFMAPRISDPKPEPNLHGTLVNEVSPLKNSSRRINIVFTLVRTRILDWDNAAGSCKTLCDALKKCRAIPDDSPSHIEVTVKQKKVPHRKEEGTLIEVTYP